MLAPCSRSRRPGSKRCSIHSGRDHGRKPSVRGVNSGRRRNFYGTTSNGGTSGQGTVFKITPIGVETVLYSFAGGFVGVADGGSPSTALIQGSDGNFYGRVSVRGSRSILQGFLRGGSNFLSLVAMDGGARAGEAIVPSSTLSFRLSRRRRRDKGLRLLFDPCGDSVNDSFRKARRQSCSHHRDMRVGRFN